MSVLLLVKKKAVTLMTSVPQSPEAIRLYNETEIRFHIIDPILRKLGYPGGDEVYLKLEEKLEYPYFHIGHKSKKKDLPLGFPDYRAGLKGARGSFIIEAKAGNVDISQGDIEQAHSYAAHAQVGANYFVLSNGAKIIVYETLSGPQSAPLVEIPIGDINARFHELENVLSPANLAKNCHIQYDLHLKLCEGLGSSTEIRSGEYGMDRWTYRGFINGVDQTEFLKTSIPQIAEIDKQLEMLDREFELKIGGGFAKRDAEGRIVAHVSFPGVTKNSAAGMKLLGINEMTFSTDDEFISIDPNSPTVFESTAEFSLSKGTMVSPLFGPAIPADSDMYGDVFIVTHIFKADDVLFGHYAATADYVINLPAVGELKLELDLFGRFKLQLIP